MVPTDLHESAWIRHPVGDFLAHRDGCHRDCMHPVYPTTKRPSPEGVICVSARFFALAIVCLCVCAILSFLTSSIPAFLNSSKFFLLYELCVLF